jgi:putative tricarboxylic transport membrane protein
VNYQDRGTSLFWFALSVVICIASMRLGIGIPQRPGMGFFPFWASAVLGVLSLILFVHTFTAKTRTEGVSLFAGKAWKKVIVVLAGLAAYVVLLPLLGYLVGTFLLMGFVYRLAGFQKWRWVIASAFLTTIATYYVFSVWLGCQFPVGFLGT